MMLFILCNLYNYHPSIVGIMSLTSQSSFHNILFTNENRANGKGQIFKALVELSAYGHFKPKHRPRLRAQIKAS